MSVKAVKYEVVLLSSMRGGSAVINQPIRCSALQTIIAQERVKTDRILWTFYYFKVPYQKVKREPGERELKNKNKLKQNKYLCRIRN